ncbi:PREDICTED: beta-glucosidase 40-like [Ipomoea nil]|uniref:beta-glucosidase 40-like n=1 Tax=Ipomoea nil TaxID=35883 RepID=UPI0009013980|nr:PREDICTED: beta-glucosidase 40-like [Ipomoea nil]
MLLRKGIIVSSPPSLKVVVFVFVVVVGLQICGAQNISRASFPEGFVFGTASAAYQFEGAVKEDGRGATIWDTFAHTPGKVTDFSNADVAVDQYHRYLEDIELMKDMGMDAYRFSIAWSRIFPNGTGKLNQAGVDHYNNLIDALLANGIEPYVTLYHYDLPQALENRYNGWLNRQVIKDFAAYAETCFLIFGDRVKQWVTINEPRSITVLGYDLGVHAPGHCSIFFHLLCPTGNSATEPYFVAHHLLLAHAAAVDIYRRKYQAKQGGKITIVVESFWYEPLTNSPADIDAKQRAIDFYLGWFLEPVMTGEYPRSVISRVGDRLPKFSAAESALLKGSYDYLGVNHYTTWYASSTDTNIMGLFLHDTLTDSGTFTLPFKGLMPIGERANAVWLYIVPRGMRNLMNYIKDKYGNPLVFITENGMDDAKTDGLNDIKRIRYHRDYLKSLLAAIKEDGCNVKGYFAWSLMDNWEWTVGFSSRFGLYYVDYDDNLRRIPKESAKWFKNFLAS